MNHAIRTSVAVVLLITTALSSVASEIQPLPGSCAPGRGPTPVAPAVVVQKVGFNQGELTKYRALGEQSRHMASHEAAGASSTTKTVLRTVGVVVVVLGIVVLVATDGGSHVPLGSGPVL